MSKLTLNIIGGLFIGFTFFKSGSTIQANQDKLFVGDRSFPRHLVFGSDLELGNFHGNSSGKPV